MGADGKPRYTAEVISAVLLGIATVASAWCTYQAALWGGTQTANLAAASIRQFDSVRRTMTASRQELVDVSVFVVVLQAQARGETDTISFLRRHARPGFKAALEPWLDDRDGMRTSGKLPFELPEYRVPDEEAAVRLQAQAARASDAAHAANANGDQFVLHTVLAALVLFLVGVTPQLRLRRVQGGVLIFGAVLLAATLVSVARLPHASQDDEVAVK